MGGAFLLGIDVGSSSLKAGAFGLDGALLAHAASTYPTYEPFPGYKEQDPAQWWDAACKAVRQILKSVPQPEIRAVGVTGHISSLTFAGADGEPLRPAIGFQDLRAFRELEELYAIFSREELARQLGIDLPPAATWPLPKLLWLKKHEPATLANARYLYQAKDYVNFRLTGDAAADGSSFRGLVDYSTGELASHVLTTLGLPWNFIPRLCRPEEVIGTVSRAAAAETGLPAGVPVVTGWNDLNACVLGSGVVREGSAFNVTGTSDHLGRVVTKPWRVPELICAPYLPGMLLFYGVTSSGGGSLAWLANTLSRPVEELLFLAAEIPPGAHSLLFLPYLDGERSPVWDPRASGAFVGLRTQHGAGHLTRAVLEGVAFSLRQIAELVSENFPDHCQPFTISGGAARASLWNQIKADILQRPMNVPQNPDAGVLGAAMLAAVGTGHYRSFADAAEGVVRIVAQVEPQPENAAVYAECFALYSQLYPALRGTFDQLHAQRTKDA